MVGRQPDPHIARVRETMTCRDCESVTETPAPSHPIARGRGGPHLLALVLASKYGAHLPLHRQSEIYAREGAAIEVSTLADWVGACAATLEPIIARIRAHVFAAERIHADDTTVPILAKGKTATGRLWTYVRDDQPFGGPDPPAAVFFASRDRTGAHPEAHLAGFRGIMQADAYAGFAKLYAPGRKPGLRRGRLLCARKAQAVRTSPRSPNAATISPPQATAQHDREMLLTAGRHAIHRVESVRRCVGPDVI